MYHRVIRSGGGPLAVTVDQLASQLEWLKQESFTFVTLSAVMAAARGERALSEDALLVTFDDAYLDTYELAWLMLRKFAVPAAVFVPTGFIGGTSAWDASPSPLMTADQLRELAAGGIEIGLHSHRHQNFAALTEDAVIDDLQTCRETLEHAEVPFVSAFAYPYGGRPATVAARARLQQRLRECGIEVAFRIGNRVNALPLRWRYEVNRLDVRGDRGLAEFRRKLRWGRWW